MTSQLMGRGAASDILGKGNQSFKDCRKNFAFFYSVQKIIHKTILFFDEVENPSFFYSKRTLFLKNLTFSPYYFVFLHFFLSIT